MTFNPWREALASAGGALPEALRSEAFLATEYATVILPNRITTREDYLRARRPGRGVALDRGKRSAVWDVVAACRAQARVSGGVDFAEAAAIAAAHLTRHAETDGHLFDHVLVDEGQDLSPTHWQLLRSLVGEHADDLFIAEDSHQRIYGRRVVLSQFGIKIVGRSRRLTLNYRTTAQTLDYAMRILKGADYVDLEEAAETSGDYLSARTAPDRLHLAQPGTHPGSGPGAGLGHRGRHGARDHRRSRPRPRRSRLRRTRRADPLRRPGGRQTRTAGRHDHAPGQGHRVL